MNGLDAVRVSLPEIVGKGYGTFWRSKHRYVPVKGSRGSKKSTTAAMKIIYKMMEYPLANTLCIRRYDVTNKDSTYAQLKWAINRLGVSHLWKSSLSPLQLTYTPTGQKIMFRGLDDPQSITSITLEYGYFCFVWIEEAFQIAKEADFDKLDLSIRGELPPGYFKQFILTFNPWDQHHWLKSRFFDNPDEDTLPLTTNYLCNEFLGKDDLAVYERMKKNSPRRYAVEGLGEWGITEGLIYENWEVKDFDWQKKLAMEYEWDGTPTYTPRFGMDFGFSIDPTTMVACLTSERLKEIWIFDEMYRRRMTNADIVRAMREKELHKQKIVADSEDPRTINELQLLGLNRITGARKGPDSVRAGIQKLQDYKIYVHPTCENTIMELSNYCWKKDKFDNPLPVPAPDGYDHILDALRYACEDLGSDNFSF